MKNLKLASLLALTVLFLFLGGCQKDEVDYRNSTKNLYQSDEKYSNSKYISVSEIREISIFFKKNSIKYGSRDNSIFDTSRVYVVEFSQNYKTYSIYLDTKKEGTIHNMVFIEENGKFSKPTIMEYQGTKQFVNDFNQRNVTFEKFEGTIAQYTFNDFFNVGRSTEIDCNCFKEYIFPIITGEPGQNNGYNSEGSSPTSDGYSPPSFNWTTWANWFSGISSGNNGNNNNEGNNSNNDDNNTNNPFSSGCPWGHISFYLFGKLHCFPIHGGGTGNNEDGELETFTTDNTGGRTTEEECLSIVKGMGIVTQESNLIQAYTSTNDPVSTQLNNCMNNSAIQAKINELESNNLFDPCSGKKISIDVKNLALDICFGCEKNGVGLTPESLEDAYYDALDGVDALIKDPTFSNCKALNCIYEKLYNSGSKMFCNNIYRFNYSDEIDLTIRVGTTYGNAEGTVTMSNNGEGVVMTFANFNCNWDDHIQLAETLLHESVHAKFRFDHAINGTSESEFKTNFLKYVNEKYGIPYTEHQLMIKNYMEKLAEELRILNDNKYDTSYYMAWVWDSLKRDWPNLFNESTVKGWNDKRDIVKMNNPFKC